MTYVILSANLSSDSTLNTSAPLDELRKDKADKQVEGSDLKTFISGLKIDVDKVSSSSFVQNIDDVPAVVDTLLGLSTSPPSIYVDLEGVNLFRQGTISILQIYVAPLDHTYLIDPFWDLPNGREGLAIDGAGNKILGQNILWGSYEVFNQRPLPVDVQKYCVQDVRFLPKLWESYNSRMTKDWAVRVDKAVIDRVREAQSSTYQGPGPHKARGPW
ncbi:3'-5' exonuclease [Botrytis cinerea]